MEREKTPKSPIYRIDLFGLTFEVTPRLFISRVLGAWIFMLALLFLSKLIFAYEMTQADIPGGITAGIIYGYLTHMWMDQ